MIKVLEHPNHINLLRWLKKAREDQGLTVRDLALLIDEPFQTVSKIENGQRNISVLEYVQYCSVLNLDPSEGIRILSEGRLLQKIKK
jgi:transcriptional regulator with XRE-family HTH domain